MHAWFTSDAHCFLSSQSKVYIPHTLSIQTTTDIRMHAWFTSDERSWSSIFQVYISIYADRIILIVQASGCIRDAKVMHIVWVHYPKCLYYIYTIFKLPLTSGCIRGSQVMHLFESTMPSEYSHIHTTFYTSRYRHQDACMVHKSCTLLEFTIPSVHVTLINTHIILKLTIDIRMYTWFTSDAHCTSPLSPVYIPTYTHTTFWTTCYRHQETCMVNKWFRCSQSQVYIPRTHQIILKTQLTSGCMHGSQVMHTARVNNPKCLFHKHTHTHDTQNTKHISIHAWFASYAHRCNPLCRLYILTYTYTCHPTLKLHKLCTLIDIYIYI